MCQSHVLFAEIMLLIHVRFLSHYHKNGYRTLISGNFYVDVDTEYNNSFTTEDLARLLNGTTDVYRLRMHLLSADESASDHTYGTGKRALHLSSRQNWATW